MTRSNKSPTLSFQLQKELKKFLKQLAYSARKTKGPIVNSGAILGDKDGSVVLTQEEAHTYQSLIDKIKAAYPDDSLASNSLRSAVINATRLDGNPVKNSQSALEKLVKAYDIPIQEWDVYIPLTGFRMLKKTKWEFGEVVFLSKTNPQCKEIFEELKQSINAALLTRVSFYAYIRVKAFTRNVAIALAYEKVELHASILNAMGVIAGSIKPKDTYSEYMPSGESINTVAIYKNKKIVYGLTRQKSVPLGGFSPHILTNSEFIRRFHWRHVHRQLAEQNRSIFMKRLLPSMKWLGRIVQKTANEEIFLCYCLALEALFFDTNYQDGELMQELKRRIYKLNFVSKSSYLGSVVTAYNKFNYLYKLRSKIVHRGGVDISDNDILLIRNMVIGSIYKMLYDKRFRYMKESSEFENWLTRS